MCKRRIDGVYLIKNNVTLKCRVGSCKDVKKRWSNYKSKLKNGTSNKRMQEDYNNYGLESFEFIILEECNVKELFKRERHWLNEYSDVSFYNKNKVVNTDKKIRTGREAKNYKQERSLVTSGEKNGHCTVLTEHLASEILWLKNNTDMKQIDIAEIYKCSPNLVSRVGNDRWKDVEESKPNWYIKKVVSFDENTTVNNATFDDVVNI
ncbi:GIY-YIG nuclease family protein [Clostridium tagluense]|uniref:GIY-YIG nuclease family protein n=1 Tax=Clostridium tagluense TaxID=360422 RepID=UPI001CF2629C|nr:GIY-YIG nuclease family protein [Clostridium tagluense]MCB2300640.1 GIY-YIG nuclease family protein [Clostridium tagluense]